MSTITVILEPHEDGTIHLPLPIELRQQTVRVRAELVALPCIQKGAKAGLRKGLPGPIWVTEDFDAPLQDFRA